MNTIAGFGDHVAAITLSSGICAALLKAKLHGEGDHVSVSLYQAAMFILSNGLLCAEYGREFPRTHFDCNSPIMQCYRCKDDEWIFLAVPEYDRMWPVICTKVLEAIQALDEIFAQQDSSYWIKLLLENDVAHEKLAHFKDVLKDEQAWANDYLLEYTYPSGDKTVVVGSPVSFGSIEKPSFKHGGNIGRDTDAVLAEAGYSEAEIAAMKESGVAK